MGQCVSALSKTSSAPESYNNTLNGFTLSDKDSELWHRKDPHPPSDTANPKVLLFVSCTIGYKGGELDNMLMHKKNYNFHTPATGHQQDPHLHPKEDQRAILNSAAENREACSFL